MTGACINAPSCFPFLNALEGRAAVSLWRPSGIHNRGQVAIERVIGTSGGYRTYRSGLSAVHQGALGPLWLRS
jgi:hypothetical protein